MPSTSTVSPPVYAAPSWAAPDEHFCDAVPSTRHEWPIPFPTDPPPP
jgi:hypothetical protein